MDEQERPTRAIESPLPAAAGVDTFEERPGGAPAMMHARTGGRTSGGRPGMLPGAPWSRLDAGMRKPAPEQAPGLNCAGDAGILPTPVGH